MSSRKNAREFTAGTPLQTLSKGTHLLQKGSIRHRHQEIKHWPQGCDKDRLLYGVPTGRGTCHSPTFRAEGVDDDAEDGGDLRRPRARVSNGDAARRVENGVRAWQ